MKRRTLLIVLLLALGAVAAATTPTGLRVLASWGIRAAESLGSNNVDDRTFDSGGVQLRYATEGVGEPVVLVHGFASSLNHNWVRTDVIDRLTRAGFQLIAYDARGHGGSEKPHDPARYGVEDVRDIVRLLDHLEITGLIWWATRGVRCSLIRRASGIPSGSER